MVRECRITMAPTCLDDADGQVAITAEQVEKRVRTKEMQDCILDAPCGPDGDDGSLIVQCLRTRESIAFVPRPKEECVLDCAGFLLDCGGDDVCDVDEARACLDEQDRCEADCPLSVPGIF